MTHKIKVQMFGNFRMDYNGAPFVAEKMHKESQFNRMMQALIHYSDCGIAKDKLEEIVIGERDIDAPHTALRVIVYKTKQKLAQLGLPGKNLIYLEGGIYYWTPDIEIEEDAAEFEKLYNEACALEKQMPQESESAETVCDERIKEIEDNMLELYVKALYLYKGEFLVAYTGETWIAQEARRYHTMFEKIINEAAYILRKRKQFKGLEKIGVYAAKVDPFNEWEELIMEAMVETRRYDEAEELYYTRMSWTIISRFIFTDMFPTENIEHMTRNIGFLDEEVIWLYTFFTDVRTSPVTFTLKELEATMAEEDYTFSRDGKTCRYQFKESGRFYTCYMVDDTSDLVHRVEIVSNGCLIRKDFYTYCRTFSEYYAPLDGKAHLYGRTFFNEDGSVCYEEVIEDDSTFYRIGAQVLYTKADLVGYMVKRLNLTADDVVIIDRTTGIGQAILENCGPARVGIVVHADHFSEGGTDDDYILWNNYYEYSFSQTEHIDFYITATDAQNELMRQQFKKYCGKEPQVVTIPVGSLDELKYPDEPRKRHSLITASRLATEKHCDWLVEAVVKAKESVPDISLDIYGKGGDEAKLKGLIGRLGCADYVHLMGQQKLDDVYKHYDAYVAASQSEGFGLTLMEAIGSGLPIVGFDVRYGNQTFIDDGQNGYKIPITDEMDQKEKIKLLSERIVRMFTEDDMDAFSGHSYEKAKEYLTKEVVHRWIELLK